MLDGAVFSECNPPGMSSKADKSAAPSPGTRSSLGTPAHRGHGFGTLPVFLAGISTILGAILFLRFGYAVGHVGMLGALGIIALGHLVTIPTALALAEIATNRRVEGGGEYFIISRSFGTSIGSVIGVSLYLSQAISVAFYMIAFAEAFQPLAPMLQESLGIPFDARLISLPGTFALLTLMLLRGASLGVSALYVVVSVLALALGLFFLGSPLPGFDPQHVELADHVDDPDPFIYVFAIVFPAFTGMTAGVGLSGDLADPRHSLPRGTLAATLVGMVVYVAVVVKLALSASPETLSDSSLVMADIALWGPIVPIGLGCATLSSAIGSILVAPRTLQAIGHDGALPTKQLNEFIAEGVGDVNEPRNATLVTGAIALVIVGLGNVDFVARLISMFFMVTYGSLCAISFLEHFAARPSYRPRFRSRWYVSLFGALICLLMMFQMDPLFAVLALLSMGALYRLFSRTGEGRRDDLGAIFEGVMTQLTRDLHVRIQRRRRRRTGHAEWRPSIICVSPHTFERSAPVQLLGWLCHRQGFGTYLHYIPGVLDERTYRESLQLRPRLLDQISSRAAGVYIDTIISPSMVSAVAQSLQVPGVSGLSNNAAMFELSVHDDNRAAEELVQLVTFAAHAEMSVLVLRHGDFHFGDCNRLHIWLTWNDSLNANLMILLGYIILGHPDWARADVRVFAALPSERVEGEREAFRKRMADGRIPVPARNIRFMAVDSLETFRDQVAERSQDADLTIVGFDLEGLAERGADLLYKHPGLKDVLFVYTSHRVPIN